MADIELQAKIPESAARGVYGLPARWYWERQVYQAERRQIFARDWQLVGPASDHHGGVALRREQLGECQPDPAARAGHDNDTLGHVHTPVRCYIIRGHTLSVSAPRIPP